MDRFQEIEKLLFYFRDYYSQNPNEEIDSFDIYSKLCLYGLENDPSFDINDSNSRYITHLWDSWMFFFQNNPGIRVEHFEQQELFLQFYNKGNVKDISNCYKLYLSFPKDKMEACVKDVFSFIAANNMVNCSKTANKTRSDSVVLRIYNTDDAIKVINYINSNPNLYSNALPTNPFVQRYGVVGMGYDYTMSYNSVVSDLIARYVSQKKETNSYETISFNDFKNYIDTLYLNLLNGVDLEDTIYNIIGNEYQSLNKEGRILNFRNIIEMLSDSLDSKKTINDYLTNIIKYKDPEVMAREKSQIKNQLYQAKIPREPEFSQEQVDLIKNYIVYAMQKYNNEDKTLLYLVHYLNGGENAITRDCNFRGLFEQLLTPEVAAHIVGHDVKTYISHVVDEYQKQRDNRYRRLFDNACVVTLNKYGVEQLIAAIKAGLEGNFMMFSNDNNARVDMIHNLPKGYYQIFAHEELERLSSQKVR